MLYIAHPFAYFQQLSTTPFESGLAGTATGYSRWAYLCLLVQKSVAVKNTCITWYELDYNPLVIIISLTFLCAYCVWSASIVVSPRTVTVVQKVRWVEFYWYRVEVLCAINVLSTWALWCFRYPRFAHSLHVTSMVSNALRVILDGG